MTAGSSPFGGALPGWRASEAAERNALLRRNVLPDAASRTQSCPQLGPWRAAAGHRSAGSPDRESHDESMGSGWVFGVDVIAMKWQAIGVLQTARDAHHPNHTVTSASEKMRRRIGRRS